MLEPFSGNNHIPDEQFKKLYSAWGKGERKMILTRNVQVDPRHLGSPVDLCVDSARISDPEYRQVWKECAQACAPGPVVMQINNPGHQTMAVQFMSAKTNLREDEFGGTAHKRVEKPSFLSGFRSLEFMRNAVVGNKLDLIGLGRPAILNPSIPRELLSGDVDPEKKFDAPEIRAPFPWNGIPIKIVGTGFWNVFLPPPYFRTRTSQLTTLLFLKSHHPPSQMLSLTIMRGASGFFSYSRFVHAAEGVVEIHGSYLNDCKPGQVSDWVRSEDGKVTQKKLWGELLKKLEGIALGVISNL
ncbi:NADPH dehydrogenase [Botrytis cinerea]